MSKPVNSIRVPMPSRRSATGAPGRPPEGGGVGS